MKKLFFSLTLLFVICVLSSVIVIISEIFLRSIGLGEPIIYEENIAYGYAPLPNQESIRLRKSRVKINSSGLRSDQDWTKENVKKILFLGDSVTYGGSYIDNPRLFSEQVCKHLLDYDVCGNAGVNSYGVLNMVLRSRYDYRISDADIVVFVVINGDFTRGITSSNVAHYFLNNPKTYFPAVEEALSFIGYKYDINKFISKSGSKPSDEKLYNNSVIGAIEFAIITLNDEIERLNKKGKKVYVFYSPYLNEISSKKQNTATSMIKKEVTNLIDMTEYFKNKKNLFYDNVHYENSGHDLVAKIISETIER